MGRKLQSIEPCKSREEVLTGRIRGLKVEGVVVEMIPRPNAGAGLTLEGTPWRTASSAAGGGGPMGCGLGVLLIESGFEFLW